MRDRLQVSTGPNNVKALRQDQLEIDTHRIISPDGTVESEAIPNLDDKVLLELYRWMLFERIFDDRAVKLQRRGRLGTYPSGLGQEASIVGAGYALSDADWVFPFGREAAMLLMHGLPMRDLILYWRGIEDASNIQKANLFPLSIAVGAHIPMSVGKAWGMRIREEEAITLATLGDGATSTGAFHEGVNLAGTVGAPIVFYCQNNQYAISLPFDKQTNADTIAQKALAYGIDGIRVDGNDVLAVFTAITAARDRALDGAPVLVESVTYRRGAHTTSDDPSRYRTDEEVGEWAARDPLDRYRAFLREIGLWDEIDEEAIEAEVDEMISDAVKAADAFEMRDIEEIFVHLYDEMPPGLQRQLGDLESILETRPDLREYMHQRPKG